MQDQVVKYINPHAYPAARSSVGTRTLYVRAADIADAVALGQEVVGTGIGVVVRKLGEGNGARQVIAVGSEDVSDVSPSVLDPYGLAG